MRLRFLGVLVLVLYGFLQGGLSGRASVFRWRSLALVDEYMASASNTVARVDAP